MCLSLYTPRPPLQYQSPIGQVLVIQNSHSTLPIYWWQYSSSLAIARLQIQVSQRVTVAIALVGLRFVTLSGAFAGRPPPRLSSLCSRHWPMSCLSFSVSLISTRDLSDDFHLYHVSVRFVGLCFLFCLLLLLLFLQVQFKCAMYQIVKFLRFVFTELQSQRRNRLV